jgi:hypothetical protein
VYKIQTNMVWVCSVAWTTKVGWLRHILTMSCHGRERAACKSPDDVWIGNEINEIMVPDGKQRWIVTMGLVYDTA